ncbi:MAG: hypothetical protein ABI688_01670 [Bacteroidota bacterium]
MKKHVFYWLALMLLVFIGCQKEVSFELGNTPAQGSLQSDVTGDCLPKSVNGAYVATTALVPATNTITIQVNVQNTGNYLITTDTVNGYFFRTTGTFTTLGNVDVVLRGNGTPFAAGIDNFIVSFDSTVCDIAVTVLPAGTGAAVYTLAGAPATCTGAVVNGTYTLGTALGAANTVALSVNVTTIGTYTITTTFQGMTFSGSGAFTATGPNTVNLTGSGTPTTAGANTVPITVAATTCSFSVTVGGAATTAVGTLGGGPGACTPSTVGGVYTVGVPVTVTNTVQVQINVTTPGTFSISSNTVAGFSFAGSGTAIAGTQVITLVSTGTPTTAGPQTFTMTFGLSTCTFTVTVLPGAGGTAAGRLGGDTGACTPSTVNGFYVASTAVTAANTVQVQINATTAGTYTISTNTVTGLSFSGTGTATLGTQLITLAATGTPTTAGLQTFTVTWANPTTSTCTFAVRVLPNDYFPRTAGSNWSYEIDNVATDSVYRIVIPNTHSALGNTYNIFMSNDGVPPLPSLDSSGYYRRNGGDYFEWIDAGAYIGFDPPAIWSEYTFLKDNVAVGTIWNSAGYSGSVNIPPPTPFTIRFKYSIAQKDVAVSIVTSTGTVNYINVIVVDEKYEQFTAGNWVDITSAVGSGKSYYARGIGLIKYEVFDGSGGSQGQQELRRFQIF